VIRDQHVAPVNNINFSIAVGTRVPRDVSFHPLPVGSRDGVSGVARLRVLPGPRPIIVVDRGRSRSWRCWKPNFVTWQHHRGGQRCPSRF